jgi:hypothetical protein
MRTHKLTDGQTDINMLIVLSGIFVNAPKILNNCIKWIKGNLKIFATQIRRLTAYSFGKHDVKFIH